MDIKQFDDGKSGKFYIEMDGTQEAEMTYTYATSHKIIIDHTEVSDKLKGKGIAHKLVEAAVAFMRKNGIKAVPNCSFVASVFKKKHEVYGDVIA